jgi:hypothetical protein
MPVETPPIPTTTTYPTASPQHSLAAKIQWSSSVCAVAGGVMLASHTEISGYGFIPLALSSGQLLAASLLTQNRSLTVYAGAVFLFVDCFGIYSWLIKH